jgi:hypothetical protein
MTPKQEAARRAMERFVQQHGGAATDIRLCLPRPEDSPLLVAAYRWTAPDGREAGIGWEEPTARKAADARAALALDGVEPTAAG